MRDGDSDTSLEAEDSAMSRGGADPDNPGGESADRPVGTSRRRWVLPAVISAILVGLLGVTVGGVLYLRGNIETLDVGDALAEPATTAPRQAVAPREANAPAEVVVDEDPLNILVMGSDTREGQGGAYGPPGETEGARSDTTLLVHIAGNRESITVLSIPRDLVTTIPACRLPDGTRSVPYEDRFNAAFYMGGPECTIRTVTELTGIGVNHFVVVDFVGFKKVVDALGGVEVCLAEPVKDPLSNLDLSAGIHRIRGEQALGFVRTRTGGLGDGSDLARIERQQEFLASMVREASSLSLLANPVKLFRTLDAITRSLTVDKKLGDVREIMDIVTGIAAVGPQGVSFVTLPNYYSEDFLTVRLDTGPATPIVESIIEDRPWPAPLAQTEAGTLKVRPREIEVTVVDRSGSPSTGVGQAGYIEALGFQVADLWTGETTPTTTIRYGPGERRAAAVLAAAVPGTRVVADGAIDGVRLVTGSDFDPGQLRRIPATAFVAAGKGEDAGWSESAADGSWGGTRSAEDGHCVS